MPISAFGESDFPISNPLTSPATRDSPTFKPSTLPTIVVPRVVVQRAYGTTHMHSVAASRQAALKAKSHSKSTHWTCVIRSNSVVLIQLGLSPLPVVIVRFRRYINLNCKRVETGDVCVESGFFKSQHTDLYDQIDGFAHF